jgi:hypothetical protein
MLGMAGHLACDGDGTGEVIWNGDVQGQGVRVPFAHAHTLARRVCACHKHADATEAACVSVYLYIDLTVGGAMTRRDQGARCGTRGVPVRYQVPA